MSITLQISLVLFAAALSIAGYRVVASTLRRARQATACEQALMRRISQLRLSKMLDYLGVPVERYVSRLPLSEIETHIYNCSHCQNLEACDHCLRDGHPVDDMHFCPNYDSLMAHSRRLAR